MSKYDVIIICWRRRSTAACQLTPVPSWTYSSPRITSASSPRHATTTALDFRFWLKKSIDFLKWCRLALFWSMKGRIISKLLFIAAFDWLCSRTRSRRWWRRWEGRWRKSSSSDVRNGLRRRTTRHSINTSKRWMREQGTYWDQSIWVPRIWCNQRLKFIPILPLKKSQVNSSMKYKEATDDYQGSWACSKDCQSQIKWRQKRKNFVSLSPSNIERAIMITLPTD